LPRHVCDSITNFIPDQAVRLMGQSLENFLANDVGLLRRQGDEDFGIVTLIGLARLGSDATEYYGGERTKLLGRTEFKLASHLVDHDQAM
jgi:hypothetical protein